MTVTVITAEFRKGGRNYTGHVFWEKDFPDALEASIAYVDSDGITGAPIWRSAYRHSDSAAEKRMMRRLLEAARFRGLTLVKRRYTAYSKTHALRQTRS